MRISISDICTGCGVCSAINPEVFEIHETFAVPDHSKVNGNEDSCIDAVFNCPVGAIHIDEF